MHLGQFLHSVFDGVKQAPQAAVYPVMQQLNHLYQQTQQAPQPHPQSLPSNLQRQVAGDINSHLHPATTPRLPVQYGSNPNNYHPLHLNFPMSVNPIPLPQAIGNQFPHDLDADYTYRDAPDQPIYHQSVPNAWTIPTQYAKPKQKLNYRSYSI